MMVCSWLYEKKRCSHFIILVELTKIFWLTNSGTSNIKTRSCTTSWGSFHFLSKAWFSTSLLCRSIHGQHTLSLYDRCGGCHFRFLYSCNNNISSIYKISLIKITYHLITDIPSKYRIRITSRKIEKYFSFKSYYYNSNSRVW